MMPIQMAHRLARFRDSVFDEMNAVARRYDAVNLGQGVPDVEFPTALGKAAIEAIASGHNQYSPIRGQLPLRKAIAAHAERFYGQRVEPETEVTVTAGVTEAMHAAVSTFVNPGDEVVVFEPFYDCYVPAIELAGGTPVPVRLHAPGFRFDPAELRAAFSPRTKAIIVNSPHNPSGIMFSRAELESIASLCQEFDVLAITDEVYEHIVFDDAKPIRLATLPGMWERTLTLSGAGKTFSCTGWRIGWAIGPAPFHDALVKLRQFTVFCAPTPLQLAAAEALAFPDSYFHDVAAEYQARRDFLVSALRQAGLEPARAQGGFFLLVLSDRASGRELCYEMARDAGVVAVPTDTFYYSGGATEIIRFSFCRRREHLEEAARRLANWRRTP
jgi:N-succinyldiaminopimelate aminotransferase